MKHYNNDNNGTYTMIINSMAYGTRKFNVAFSSAS